MKKKSFFLFFLGWVFLCACAPEQTASDPCTKLQVGCVAPDFVLNTPAGETYSVKSNSGKSIVLNFWATWCPPCQAEMPDLENLYEDYLPQGLVVLGVNSDDPAEGMAIFGKAFHLTFPLLVDKTGDVSNYYQIRAYPTSYFIDRGGKIIHIHVGRMNYKEFEQVFLNHGQITLQLTITPIPTPTQPLVQKLRGCVISDALNIRPGPSKEVSAINWLTKGECRWFRGRTADNQWLKLDGELGWASAKWIRLEGAIAALPVVDQ